jgi:hypothetical protein
METLYRSFPLLHPSLKELFAPKANPRRVNKKKKLKARAHRKRVQRQRRSMKAA